jgi:2,4-dienoyl-CoA reductase-like NADH-dependent reductase (Old Yellow Enzyme family)
MGDQVTGPGYPELFRPITLAGHALRNRVTHASMTTRMARDQRVTPQQVDYYRNRARGGCALIVTEPLNGWRRQKAAHKVRAWDEGAFGDLQRWAAAVEEHNCRLLGQIQDPGRGRHERGRNPFAFGASSLPDDLSWTVPHVMSVADIREMIEDFAATAERLQRAGFSGVEISAGHGHLFHQFMSEWSNRRDDDYGGSLDNRLRLTRELIEAVRSACGQGFIVGLKLPGDDGVPGGIGPDEAAVIAPALCTPGAVDYVCFTWGAHARSLDMHIPDAHWPRAPFIDTVRRLKATVPGTPVMAVGYITDPAEAEGILARGDADLIALGRPLVTDPAWASKAAHGREKDIRYCVSCNSCWGRIMEHAPLACDNNPRVAMPDETDYWPERARQRRRIVVVGAGVAGMEAAWVAAARGHDVTVFGTGAETGGKTRLHAALPGGENLSSVFDYQTLAARRAGARLELGVTARPGDVISLAPDAVILATGSTMAWPGMLPEAWQHEGLVPDLRALMPDLVRLQAPQGGTAVLFDMDHTEATYAATQVLSRLFDRVVLLTPRDRIAEDTPLVTRLGILRRLSHLGVEVWPLNEPSPCSDLESGLVLSRNVYTGQEREIPDVVLLTYSTPRIADDGLAAPLERAGLSVHRVGDCYAPRGLMAATAEGHAAGHEV